MGSRIGNSGSPSGVDHLGISGYSPTITRGATAFVGIDGFADRCTTRRIPTFELLLMRKLDAVEEARAIMTQGLERGVFKWLLEKRKARIIADKATAALNDAEDKVKATWSDELKRAYNAWR
jgi:hypothetical protein